MTPASMPLQVPDAQHDRRALGLFGLLALVFWGVAGVPVLRTGSLAAWDGWALLLLMWAPGAAALITTLVVYRSLAPLGLGLPRRSWGWAALCLALPLAYTLAIYPALQALGLVSLGHRNAQAGVLGLGLLLSLRNALGEELGWRGLAAPLVTRWLGFVPGQLALGGVWFIYHLPLLLMTSYGQSPHPLFGNTLFALATLGLGFFLGWVRLRGGSVWPCALLHASHNLLFLHLFDPLVLTDPAASWLVGEQGALFAAVQLLLGAWAWRRAVGGGSRGFLVARQ